MNWKTDSTSCERARATITDSLIVGISTEASVELDAHLATCADCRAYRAECSALWSSLGEIPTPAAPRDAPARFERALQAKRFGSASHTSRGRGRWLGFAAGLLAAVGLGYALASWRGRPEPAAAPVASAADTSRQYLLLLYDTQATSSLSPAQLASVVAEYSAWARGLRAVGKLVTAEKLTDAPSEWYGGSVSATMGERVGGFFLIRATDLADARRIAADCPHVRHGGRVELRAIQKT